MSLRQEQWPFQLCGGLQREHSRTGEEMIKAQSLKAVCVRGGLIRWADGHLGGPGVDVSCGGSFSV